MQTRIDTTNQLDLLVDRHKHPLDDEAYRAECKHTLNKDGVLTLHDFLSPEAIAAICQEGDDNQHLAYYTASEESARMTFYGRLA